ncbi:hypothetical protein ACFSW8_09615 [Rubritalea tangerina]|uniref:CBM-cenC domain-containing protein n=2 Tax=Rubritalea tangerina TaxID=430798 RepID=A0ABW4ZB22_9BACT
MKLRHSTLFVLTHFSLCYSGQSAAIALKNPSFESPPVQAVPNSNPNNNPFNDHNYNHITEIPEWGIPTAPPADRDYSSAIVRTQNWVYENQKVTGFNGQQSIWLLNDRVRATQSVRTSLKPGFTYDFTLAIAHVGKSRGSIVMRIESPTSVLAEKYIPFTGQNLTLSDHTVSYTAKSKEHNQIFLTFGVRDASDNVFLFDNARLEERKLSGKPVQQTTTPPVPPKKSPSVLLNIAGISIALDPAE